MRRFACLVLAVVVFITTFPSTCFAISAETHIVPGIGNLSEKLNDFSNEKIDLAPIKLPKRISHFELLEAERALAPNLLKDQIGLWTAPLRIKTRDLVWFVPFSGALTALLLTDDDFSYALTNRHDVSDTQRRISKSFANIGGYAPILGTPGGLILIGAIAKNDRLRETGVLQYEGLINAAIIGTISQKIAGRNKPNNRRKGRGQFFEGGTSFPSGHAISSWTLASIAAHQYPDKKWVPVLSYSLASLITSSRVLQGTHFTSDIFAGAVFGYLLGKYIVKHRSKHSPKYNKDKQKPTKQN